MASNVIYPTDAFNARVDEFLIGLNALIADHFKTSYKNLSAPVVSADPGHRYIRVVREDTDGPSRSVHCFIDKTNGDVLKAAGWKAPAKVARGNIFNPDCGLGAVTVWGAKYL